MSKTYKDDRMKQENAAEEGRLAMYGAAAKAAIDDEKWVIAAVYVRWAGIHAAKCDTTPEVNS